MESRRMPAAGATIVTALNAPTIIANHTPTVILNHTPTVVANHTPTESLQPSRLGGAMVEAPTKNNPRSQ